MCRPETELGREGGTDADGSVRRTRCMQEMWRSEWPEGREGGASWWGAGEALRPPLSVVLRSGPRDDRSISSLVCLVVSRQRSSLSPNLMGHPFGRLFTLDVPDCIPQFHCEILFRERLRPNHACTLSDLVLPRGTVEDGERAGAENKKRRKRRSAYYVIMPACAT